MESKNCDRKKKSVLTVGEGSRGGAGGGGDVCIVPLSIFWGSFRGALIY